MVFNIWPELAYGNQSNTLKTHESPKKSTKIEFNWRWSKYCRNFFLCLRKKIKPPHVYTFWYKIYATNYELYNTPHKYTTMVKNNNKYSAYIMRIFTWIKQNIHVVLLKLIVTKIMFSSSIISDCIILTVISILFWCLVKKSHSQQNIIIDKNFRPLMTMDGKLQLKYKKRYISVQGRWNITI